VNSLQKTVAFLLVIGFEKGSKVMDLMDSDEVKNIIPEFGNVSGLLPNVQENVWREFVQLGYEAEMNPVETLYVLRQLFNGGKISDKEKKRYWLA
jgi:flagellar motor switch protein FliG